MKIVLTPNPYRDKQFENVRRAKRILEEEGCRVAVCLPFEVDKGYVFPNDLKFTELRSEIKDADLLICFGGDGTILHASKFAMQNHIPVLGVNIGTMGFIAELESGEMELLRRLPRGDYSLEERSMLDVTVTNGQQQLLHDIALNDAVVTKGAIARVVNVSVRCDGVEATSFSGDGVIVCTPTGSTGYSMSAGGPIVEPSAKNLIITPICAHAMLARTIITSPKRVIELRLGKTGRHNAFLSVDGGRAFRLGPGDVITVRASEQVTQLVRLKDTGYFDVLNTKFIDRQRK